MRAGIPVGARVFTCEWGLTGNLMLALPDRRFLVALAPTLFQAKDPELYKLWYAMSTTSASGSCANNSRALRRALRRLLL